MSTISVTCTDQVLAITNSPVLASGGVNENEIQFTFCSLWTGYAKTCIFYQEKNNVYYSILGINNKCVIPAEATANAGRMYFAVMGVNADGAVRTSELLSYRVVEGVVTEVPDPSPSVYEQIMADIADLHEEVAEALEEIEDMTDDAEAWAVGKRGGVDVPSTDPTYHNNAKYYSEQAAPSNIVQSFNGRRGAVVPAANDYSFSQVSGTAAVAQGGTGATTASQARANLGCLEKTELSVTLLAASWVSGSQTVIAVGVTSSNTVITSPAPASYVAFSENLVRCSAQGNGTLTFACSNVPVSDLVVNVLILS